MKKNETRSEQPNIEEKTAGNSYAESPCSAPDENAAYCACLKIHYAPIEEDKAPGLLRERWICNECGQEFIKKPND